MSNRGTWGSRAGFVLAAAGSAVGLGNIWRFPYTAGQNGGALFVLIYLISVIAIALPVLLGELALGRFTGKNPVGAYRQIAPKSWWTAAGYLGVLTGFMILSFYAVIAGWTTGYFFKAISGQFAGLDPQKAGQVFSTFTANAPLQIGLLALFLVLTAWVVSRGVSKGIESFSKVLMPLLLGILLLLPFRALTLDRAGGGLAFYLKPHFTRLNPRVVVSAMGQAFFSLSLGMGTMITYGSYMSRKEHLPSAALWVALCDTLIAILAGFIIFPAVFSQSMDPAGGPGLVFNILPVIFAQIPGGQFFGALFFALLAIAALTSTISVLEVPVAYFVDERGWSRRKATTLVSAICFAIGIPVALSQGAVPFLGDLPWLHWDFLRLWDFLWGNLSLSIGALALALYVVYVWKTRNALKEIQGDGPRPVWAPLWTIAVSVLAPLLIGAILLTSFI